MGKRYLEEERLRKKRGTGEDGVQQFQGGGCQLALDDFKPKRNVGLGMFQNVLR